jgi:hypothetical protein
VNGNLSMVDRGRKKDASQNSIGVFQYDLEGHIINRADSPTAITSGDVLVGYHSDPNQPNYNGSGDYYGGYTTLASDLAQSLFGYGGVSGTTHLQSYLYADNHSISELRGSNYFLNPRTPVPHKLWLTFMSLFASAAPINN